MKIKFLILAVVFCLCLAGCSERNLDKQSSAESQTSSQSKVISSKIDEEESGQSETPVLYWSSDREEISRLSQLQQMPDISNIDDIKELVGGLLNKSRFLCMLAEKRIYNADIDTDIIDNINMDDIITTTSTTDRGKNIENEYYPVTSLPYKNTDDFKKDIYTVFDEKTAEKRLFYMFNSENALYKDFNGQLYCEIGVDGVGKQHSWDINSLSVKEISDKSILLDMNVEFREKWSDTLEIIYDDGLWRLNDSYFAGFLE